MKTKLLLLFSVLFISINSFGQFSANAKDGVKDLGNALGAYMAEKYDFVIVDSEEYVRDDSYHFLVSLESPKFNDYKTTISQVNKMFNAFDNILHLQPWTFKKENDFYTCIKQLKGTEFYIMSFAKEDGINSSILMFDVLIVK